MGRIIQPRSILALTVLLTSSSLVAVTTVADAASSTSSSSPSSSSSSWRRRPTSFLRRSSPPSLTPSLSRRSELASSFFNLKHRNRREEEREVDDECDFAAASSSSPSSSSSRVRNAALCVRGGGVEGNGPCIGIDLGERVIVRLRVWPGARFDVHSQHCRLLAINSIIGHCRFLKTVGLSLFALSPAPPLRGIPRRS